MIARLLRMYFVRASMPSFLFVSIGEKVERRQKRVPVGSELHTEEVVNLMSVSGPSILPAIIGGEEKKRKSKVQMTESRKARGSLVRRTIVAEVLKLGPRRRLCMQILLVLEIVLGPISCWSQSFVLVRGHSRPHDASKCEEEVSFLKESSHYWLERAGPSMTR